MAIFLGSTTFFVQSMLTVSHNGNPIIYHNYIEMKIIHKKLE